jgi:uncharacterized protein YccT (UPF0319 family)
VKVLGLLTLMLGTAVFASAITAVPEIDGSSLATGIALVSGALLVARGRRK